jgi:hypothetical protein
LNTAKPSLGAMLHTTKFYLIQKFEKLRAMLHSAESRLLALHVKINSLISARNLNRIRVIIRALGAIDL